MKRNGSKEITVSLWPQLIVLGILDKMLEKKLTRKIHTLLIKMELKMDIKWVFWNVWKEWKIAVVGELLVLNG